MRGISFCLMAALFFAAGCGDGRHCEDRQGSYLAKYNEVSGDCHVFPDGLNLYAEGNGDYSFILVGVDCTGGMKISKDNCSARIDETCPSTVFRGTTTYKGIAEWSDDGTSGSATLEYMQWNNDGSLDCKSVYEITYEKVDRP